MKTVTDETVVGSSPTCSAITTETKSAIIFSNDRENYLNGFSFIKDKKIFFHLKCLETLDKDYICPFCLVKAPKDFILYCKLK